MNTHRNRSTSRVTTVSLVVSGVVHAALLAWVAFPVRETRSAERTTVMTASLADPLVLLPLPVQTAATSASSEEGSGGEPSSAASAAAPRPVIAESRAQPEPETRSITDALVLAAADSVESTVVTTPAAVVADVVAEEASDGDGVQVAVAAAAAPAHRPGSAARAKGGAGASVGKGSSGKGGLGVSIRKGKGPKRHPPRGLPGRGRW